MERERRERLYLQEAYPKETKEEKGHINSTAIVFLTLVVATGFVACFLISGWLHLNLK
jgi:hypothetical protein